RHSERRVFLLSTTHGAENHALAAARAVIRIYREGPVTERIWSAGRSLMEGLNSVSRENGIAGYFEAFGYFCTPYFVCKDATGELSAAFRTLLLQEMVRNGLLMTYIAPSTAPSDT